MRVSYHSLLQGGLPSRKPDVRDQDVPKTCVNKLHPNLPSSEALNTSTCSLIKLMYKPLPLAVQVFPSSEGFHTHKQTFFLLIYCQIIHSPQFKYKMVEENFPPNTMYHCDFDGYIMVTEEYACLSGEKLSMNTFAVTSTEAFLFF